MVIVASGLLSCPNGAWIDGIFLSLQTPLTIYVHGKGMSQISSIPARAIALTSERPRGYSSAEQVRNRAAVSNPNETPHERRAVTRLGKVLDNNDMLRPDVPRGYYLDIKV